MLNIENRVEHNRNYYYDILKLSEECLKDLRLEESIAIIDLAARFSTTNFCGFYVDRSIEELLNAIGKIIFPSIPSLVGNSSLKKLRVLHYATILLDVGGHTRLIENWINTDSSNIHDVFVSKQNIPIPDFFKNTIDATRGKVYEYSDSLTFLERIKSLNDVSKDYDLIVLHHHPDDIIPVIAFPNGGTAPVAILNHGDHKYWVGSSICDILIEIRDNLVPYDKYRRGIKRFSLLPIPLKLPLQGSYNESRAILGIKEQDIVLLSIGSEYKFQPFEGKNFFEDIIDVLNENKRVKLFLVGISPESNIAATYPHKNITYVGPTPNIEIFKRACDIYIEGYPFSSFTAYLEVGILGKPVHFMYDAPLLNIYCLSTYENPPAHFNNKHEWECGIFKLINDIEFRLERGKQISSDILINHVMPGWIAYLNKFYLEVVCLRHEVNLDFQDNFVLGSNEVYLDHMLGHDRVNVIEKSKKFSFVHKLQLAYKFFIKENYLDLMFANYSGNLFSEAIGWPLIFKLSLLLRMFINKDIKTVKRLKDCVYFLLKY